MYGKIVSLFSKKKIMQKQNYNNHRMYYIPHHFVYLPLLVILLIFGLFRIFNDEKNRLVWVLFSILIFLILYLAVMLRQHYALGLQNRTIRLEFRQRYFEIFKIRSEQAEQHLSFGQIAALRFADDEEFAILLEKALKDNWSADKIKKNIRNWKPDHNRV